MKKSLLLVAPLILLSLVWAAWRQRSAPPEVPFARAARGTLASTLVTNGVVEPVEWAGVVSETAGAVRRLLVQPGTRLREGDAVAELGVEDREAELAAAEARVEQALAELRLWQQGGRSSQRAAIAAEMAAARADLEGARKDRDSLARLVDRQAAPRQELTDAERRLQRAELQLSELEKRSAALVDASDRQAAEARLREAEAAAGRARAAVQKAVIRSPMAGVVYQTDIRQGAVVQPGQAIARVGRTERFRVRVYVDEPELGRVAPGMPVAITWDALQGRRWLGAVERMPAQINALGSRHVGEVICVVANPAGELLPGANVNAEIRSGEAAGALSIPREALRREEGATGVFLLQGDRVVWRQIAIGITSVTRVQVTSGLAEGDAVALPGDAPLADGAAVRPVFR